eukprot:Nitzschia sp. Nitz4//scaffold21_size171442//144018//145286//NITZ4_002189-RA/size171442-processed-gene-0.168-mRNA-1//-1//CDS//3329542495//2668//frame0
MWSGEEDINEKGETVKLSLPANGPPRRTNTDVVDSHIGGHAHALETPKCAVCQDNLFLLSQLRSSTVVSSETGKKMDRTVYVFACPKAKCFEALSFQNGFSSGTPASMACRVSEVPVEVAVPPAAPVKSQWYADQDDDDDDDGGWGDGPSEGATDMASLEAAMNAMEAKLEDGAIAKTPKSASSKAAPQAEVAPGFPCFMLTEKSEPLAPHKPIEEDDVGLTASDDKIRNMLARYMAEEEDEMILAALKGSDVGGGTEEDERLSDDERVLLAFQDRLRRAPRQVIRTARGGVPLWSIPSTKKNKPIWSVPTCSVCNTQCTFEMQLLPSLLHVLQVDKYASGASMQTEEASALGDLLSNGMNWGSVAVYTCPCETCTSTEGHLVVQKSVDESPVGNGEGMDFTPAMAVVEDMDDDDDFEPYKD